jgi:DNA mismatch repair ATPase MutS
MHRDRDFGLPQPLPWNAPDLTQDLELDSLLHAMAGEDQFLLDVARNALLSGLRNDVDTILYRQLALKDCLKNAAIVRDLYNLTVETTEGTRKRGWGISSHYPSSMLYSAIDLLEKLLGGLRNLRDFADEQANRFESEAFTGLLAMLRAELAEDYLGAIQKHLTELKFRGGVLLSAELGEYNEGTNYVLREAHEKEPHWLRRIFGNRTSSYTFYLDERDEAGTQILSEMRYRGISRVAVALAQSADHVLSFFKMLPTELAFYIGCLNLHDRLAAKGEPVCFPTPQSADERTLRFHGLYDVCLSLNTKDRAVGNDVGASGKSLLIVTGANRGGKSTFLRSIGLAQLMMQSGMFVAAEHIEAAVCPALYTHNKREEDTTMKSGKLDEELARMSQIVDHILPNSIVLFNESFAATNEREGSEIARQIVTALLEKRIRVFFVTHLYEFANAWFNRKSDGTMFLRAERPQDGIRTFRLLEAQPLETSYGGDLYRQIFELEQQSADKSSTAGNRSPRRS